jgi:hypothetical protein
MKNTQKTTIGVLCLVILIAGCGSKREAVAPTVAEPEPLVFTSSTGVIEKPTTTVRVGASVLNVETVIAENGTVKHYALKKDGSAWKTIEAGFGESGIQIFKQTKQYVYLAPEIDGLGGYILYEALPTRVIRVDLKTGDQKVFQFGGVLEDISDDDKQMLWVIAGQGSLSFAVYDTATGKRTLTIPVEKKFSQAGNARFSPDMKKFAYAAALGIPDREGGVIMSVDIAKKQQTKLIEDLHSNKVPRVYGWRTASIVDYRFE